MIARAQHSLARRFANGPKVGLLFFFFAIGCFFLDAVGVRHLSNPWFALSLSPNFLIYLAERRGKLVWFRGMVLPSLLVQTASVALVWIMNTNIQLPMTLGYCALASLFAAFGFLLFRMWFSPSTSGATK